jgi:hypothetical protein
MFTPFWYTKFSTTKALVRVFAHILHISPQKLTMLTQLLNIANKIYAQCEMKTVDN